MIRPRRSMLAFLLVLTLACRLVPYALARLGLDIDPATTIYPWNFSPLLPLSLFGAAFYADRRLAYMIPWMTYGLGDLGIWALTGRFDWAFYAYQPLVYASVGFVVAMGTLLRERRSWPRVAGVGLISASGFFVVTNFGVWAFGDGVRYPHTIEGLVTCYVTALPYFRNTLISLAVFLPLLFSRASLRKPVPTPNTVPVMQRG